jgi:hypothetical protein
MKHAGPQALDLLDDLLVKVRAYNVLIEKNRGTFYRKSSAFLHFHEDPQGLFADIRAGADWQRFPVTTKAQQKTLLGVIKTALGGPR